MGIENIRNQALDNIHRFKDALLDQRIAERNQKILEKNGNSQQRTYQALLNSQTGALRFVENSAHLGQRLSSKETGSLKDWKVISIEVQGIENEVHFEARGQDGRALSSAELAPLASRVANETISLLNQKGKRVLHIPKGMLPEEYILQDFPLIDQSPIPGLIGNLSRIKAEELLLDQKPIGTFIVREADPMIASTMQLIAKANDMDIKPYILTVIEEGGKISDHVICETNRGWMFYNKDNPKLSEKSGYVFHKTAHELLSSIRHFAKHPYTKHESIDS